jgi:hypothetical protein
VPDASGIVASLASANAFVASAANPLFGDDEFRRVRAAQDREITQALFVKPIEGAKRARIRRMR